MALSFTKLFTAQQLAAAVADIFQLATLPAGNVMKNGRVRLTNTTAGAVTATLYIAPAAGTVGADNMFLSAVSIAANSYLDTDIPTMAAGDKLRGFAGAATSITIQEMGGAVFS